MSLLVKPSPRVVFPVVATLAIVIFFACTYLSLTETEHAIQKSLSEVLELVLSDKQENDGVTQAHLALNSSPEPKKEGFAVAARGFWQGLKATKHHHHDDPLARAIVAFLKTEKVSTLLELGAGMGKYAKEIKAAGILVSCYDGNPNTQDLSEGRCAVLDLSKPIDLSPHDWVLSLEVGEHIPMEFEDIFMGNLVRTRPMGIIVSWAVEGQGGTSHVNNRNNEYIRNKMGDKGYTSVPDVEKILRTAATADWFKNTIMVFRKQ